MRKIGILGGAGYIGSALSAYLSRSFKVRVLDKNPIRKELYDRIEYRKCDILDYNAVAQGLKDINLVVHVAVVQIPLINEVKELGYKVNIIGIQNVCRVVDESPTIEGMILAGSWHVFGEKDIKGLIAEDFGFRPDKVEDRARFYCLSKIGQEVIVRMYDEFSNKIYGVVRIGTVLGEGMPEKTAANIFIEKGLKGESLTPYKHSMYRPMLYIDINDVCKTFLGFLLNILGGETKNKEQNSIAHVLNLAWPQPISILDLSYMVRDAIVKFTRGRIEPSIEIVDKGLSSPYDAQSKKKIKVDVSKVLNLLDINLTNPQKSIERIVKSRI